MLQSSARALPFDFRRMLLTGLLLCLVGLTASCSSDLKSNLSSNGTASDSTITIQVGSGIVALTEGGAEVAVPVNITRIGNLSALVTLTAEGSSTADERKLNWAFEDSSLGAGENSTNLILSLAIDNRPIKPHTRVLQVRAVSGSSTPLVASLDIQVQPTDKPDVYLIVGQSNSIGFSEDDSKQAAPGQADAPDSRIRQLNVTGNDDTNFATAEDFTDDTKLYNLGSPLTIAIDPLHDGFDSSISGKSGQRISYALSFAKQALNDTTTDIYLVPAAWSDTGFCKRTTNRFPGIGWNATPTSNPALSGTLLHDRAIARANIALAETDGILRGILWHQGEADSDTMACAELYAQNLTELIASLRTNIAQDARGAVARGSTSDVPFIAGTMSKGEDSRGSQLPFGEAKLLVDSAHRTISTLVPTMTNFVNNDDLVPPAYACGEGSCVHFGADAYREMGIRYYESLMALFP